MKSKKGENVGRSELISKLQGMNISRDSYAIDEISNESLCLICENTIWKIFYSERGQRTEEEWHANEIDACQAFLLRLTHVLGI